MACMHIVLSWLTYILRQLEAVAVAALLNEVGAPPRLKVHIAGESLLNDGSAIVFYTIFSSLFLLELDIPGLGKDYDIGSGISYVQTQRL